MSQPVEKKRPNPSGGADYKHKLDEAATQAKSAPHEEAQKPGVVDKGLCTPHQVQETALNSERLPLTSSIT
jgi:hypothetical protein